MRQVIRETGDRSIDVIAETYLADVALLQAQLPSAIKSS
jgi:hypothetical protein